MLQIPSSLFHVVLSTALVHFDSFLALRLSHPAELNIRETKEIKHETEKEREGGEGGGQKGGGEVRARTQKLQ